MRLITCLCLKWPSSCASTASTSPGDELAQQRVEEHHALGGTEAGEVGVGVRRALAAVHHEQTLGRKAAARISACTRAFSASSASGSNLLKSGAITVG